MELLPTTTSPPMEGAGGDWTERWPSSRERGEKRDGGFFLTLGDDAERRSLSDLGRERDWWG